jgi:hypothetical protein
MRYGFKPQFDWPGWQVGIGPAKLAATMTVFAFVVAGLEASIWSAVKPVISIPRARTRIAIFIENDVL